ncbi:MAG: hypothetical protein CL675_00395 [Bdellovibrionaceae bacterium]|nr:hypothetical protein [Pseudobdellovibrionaceae bacterium]
MKKRIIGSMISAGVMTLVMADKPVVRGPVQTNVLAVQEQKATQIADRTTAKMKSIKAESEVETQGLYQSAQGELTGQSPVVKQYKTLVNGYRSLKGSVFRDGKRKDIAEEFMDSPESTQLLVKLFEDESWRGEVFGADQAEARVYAIRMIELYTKSHGPAAVDEVVQKLNDRLSQSSLSGGHLKDLEDLLRVSIRAKGTAPMDNLDHFLDQTGFIASVRSAYQKALWASYWGRVDDLQQLQEQLMELGQ